MNENCRIFAGRQSPGSESCGLAILNTGLTAADCPAPSELSLGQQRVIALILRRGYRAVLERRAADGAEPSWFIVAYFEGKQMKAPA